MKNLVLKVLGIGIGIIVLFYLAVFITAWV